MRSCDSWSRVAARRSSTGINACRVADNSYTARWKCTNLFPLVRIKPGFTGPDGGNTTFFVADIAARIPGSNEPDGFPNFFGTSASAPHVAAIGALMLDQRARDVAAGKHFIGPKQLRPEAMYLALRLSAIRQDIRQR